MSKAVKKIGKGVKKAVKSVGKVIKKVAPIALPVAAVAFPGLGATLGTWMGASGAAASALGNAAIGAVSGGLSGGTKGALLGGALGGLGGYAQGGGFSGMMGGNAQASQLLGDYSNQLTNLANSGQITQEAAQQAMQGYANSLSQQGMFSSFGDQIKSMVSSGLPPTQIGQQLGLPAEQVSALAQAATGGSNPYGLLGSLGQMAGGYLQGQQAQDAAKTAADAQIKAAQIAADAAKFKPVGVSTRFGTSNFGYDANGNLTSAGYTLSPEMKAQQDALMGISNNMLTQYQGAQQATAPMGEGAQRAMTLGNQYLAADPAAQAKMFYDQQQAVLAAQRNEDYANLESRLAAQGRLGFAIGGGNGMMAANPEMAALYNARRQQDLQLAANATQGGMDYAKFGAGMLGTGGDLLKSMYGTQSAAYTPYSTALGGATMLEGLGQNAMDLGINIGAKGSAASANSGNLIAQGMTNAANTMQPSNSYSPWGTVLSQGGQMLSQYGGPSQQQQMLFNPYTGVRL